MYKIGVTIDGCNYLVKYPTSTIAKNMKNTSLMYINGSISEYIGSKIFSLFGIPVHEVELVQRNGKVCAMCRDFIDSGRLIEFRELKVTFEPGFIDSNGDVSDGTSTDIDEALLVIHEHHILRNI